MNIRRVIDKRIIGKSSSILKEAFNAAVSLSLLLVRKCCMVHGDCSGGSDEARTHHPSSALPGDSLVTRLSACLIESQSVHCLDLSLTSAFTIRNEESFPTNNL